MRYIEIEKLLIKRPRWGNRRELWKNKKLQADFRKFFFNKCWYTEVIFIGHDPQVDHFRPKGKVRQYEHYNYNTLLASQGYYWLTNDPSNYRLCCVFANRKTGEGGKGCYFPLSDTSPILAEGGSEIEEPLLIDPCKREDVELVSFMGNQVVAASTKPLDQMRVDISKKIYNLIDPYIKAERAKIWDSVAQLLAAYEKEEISRSFCLLQLEAMVSRDSQFSVCAIACVNSLAPDEIKAELDLTL